MDEDRLDRIEAAILTLAGKIDGVDRAAYVIGAACLFDPELRTSIMDGLQKAEERARTLNAHAEEIAVLSRFREGFEKGLKKSARPRGKPR